MTTEQTYGGEGSAAQPQRRAAPTPQMEPIDPDLVGEFRWISKTKLVVPTEDYQRDQSDSKLAVEVAAGWNWIAFGALTVSERPDGTLVVMEGGTRLVAARKRKDVDLLPCMVHRPGSPQKEAEGFRIINMCRNRLKVQELHHTELFEGRDLALDSQDWMDQLADGGVAFNALAEIRRQFKNPRRRALAWKVLPVLIEVGTGCVLSRKVLMGLMAVEAELYRRDKSVTQKPYLTKLREKGLRGLDSAIEAHVPPKTGGGTARLFFEAVRNALRVEAEA